MRVSVLAATGLVGLATLLSSLFLANAATVEKKAAKPTSTAPAPDKSFAKGAAQVTQLDKLLAEENAGKPITEAPIIDDLAFLRRLSVDLLGRIPAESEIQQYLSWPAESRRANAVDQMLKDDRFVDRWSVFFADLLRIRSGYPGGDTLMAFVHQAIEDGMPYDQMCRQLIVSNGKAGKTPEVGFILGDDADPLALAGVTAQTFMGIRVSCAQCHDHPFDVWTREQFYGLAAYFGKIRRYESQLTKAIYTTETDEMLVLWPPEDEAKGEKRQPMKPNFPFELASADGDAVVRLASLRKAAEEKQKAAVAVGPSLDDLLAEASDKIESTKKPSEAIDVAAEAQSDARKLNVEQDLYRASELRKELADMVTSPRNRFFSRSLVNRLWAELIGRGIVDPVDDFNSENPPSHPKTLDYLADEFVASGYELRTPIRMILLSQAYQRGQLATKDEVVRDASEKAFVAAPLRRMISEALFDSIVLAGHLFDVKHPAGENITKITTIVRQEVKPKGEVAEIKGGDTPGMEKGMAMAGKPQVVPGTGYDLESSIELNFDELLAEQDEAAPDVEKMSAEEIEAQEMMYQRRRYIDREVTATVDDNPKFTSAMRMASPAPPAHFLRIFGQTGRDDLGQARDHTASMRQALMMLNGKLTNEAARVGKLEPMYALLVGKTADQQAAIRLAYREILTREPNQEEIDAAKEVMANAEGQLEGMADLRWALLNSHEFRYLP